jgi:hypothetical protein
MVSLSKDEAAWLCRLILRQAHHEELPAAIGGQNPHASTTDPR